MFDSGGHASGLNATLFEASCLADAITKEVEFRAVSNTRAFDFNLGNPWRVNGKLSLDPFASHDSSNREHFRGTATIATDNGAGKDLRSRLVTFENQTMHVNRVANFELWRISLETSLIDEVHYLLTHDFNP